MELKLATAEKKFVFVLEELVKLVQSRGLRGENGGWKEFLDAKDKKIGQNDPSKRSHDELVAFLTTFKEKQDLQVLKCHANFLLIEKSRNLSLIRLTIEHPAYSLDYSFEPHSEDWFVSDVGMKTSRTDITGITAEDIEKATLSLVDIQETLQPFLSNGAILVGHSLNKDLESILGYEVRRQESLMIVPLTLTAAMKLALAVIEKRSNTTIPSKEMLEVEKPKLLYIKSHNVTSKDLEQVLSGEFTLDVKPAKTLRGCYCAFVVFIAQKKQIKHLKTLKETKARWFRVEISVTTEPVLPLKTVANNVLVASDKNNMSF
ncbi:hypothetical protein Bca52824_000636 [Brassica carinata]|uniref:Exonuclease domain-containing protein n=1 Tax=Brassica carinata TaxID=52824 RepID=A0A8X7WH66_BRACI|nr:hypothetical protein Bca52824_000636 [Brassica carinata]